MKKFYDCFSKALTVICFTLLITFTILVAVQVISRYVFNSPTTWTELAARYLFVWTVMLYMPVLYRQKNNASFDLVYKKFTGKFRIVLDIGINLSVFLCGIFLARWGFLFCSKMSNRIIIGLSTNIKIPMNVVYYAIPVGGIFLVVMCIEQFLKNFCELRGDRKCCSR